MGSSHLCENEWQEEVGERTNHNRQCRKCAIKIRASKHHRKVRNIDTGEVFESLKDAELKTAGKIGHNIIACCKGLQKTAYGFHWEYAEA